MKKYAIALIGGFFLLISCGGKDPAPEPPPVVVIPPSAATLIFPDNNTECNEGTIISETQSTVLFQWNASENTDQYQLNLRNLNANATSLISSVTNQISVNILRGTPYEWFVVSKANGINTTATSTLWKFYNQGPGVENYAPFPADIIRPSRGATVGSSGTITLEWAGNDVDNDIVEYEVYLDTAEPPATLVTTTTESIFEVDVTSNTIYYWRIITIDSQGNTTASEIFEFKVS